MVDLIGYIDNATKDCVTEIKQFGLCHLLEGDNEKFPATVETDAVKAVPDDLYLICSYHRLLNGTIEPKEDLSFGKSITGQNNQRVRTVVFSKLGTDDSKIDDIINSLPDVFEVDGYRFANVSKNITLIRDRDAIWSTEFDKAYKDKYQLVWNIYAIEFDLQYIKCNVCV